MGGHGCIVPGRGCQAVQALEQLYQQSPTVAIVVGAALVIVVCMLVLWLRDLRGQTNWEPHRPYEPPQASDRDARDRHQRQESARR